MCNKKSPDCPIICKNSESKYLYLLICNQCWNRLKIINMILVNSTNLQIQLTLKLLIQSISIIQIIMHREDPSRQKITDKRCLMECNRLRNSDKLIFKFRFTQLLVFQRLDSNISKLRPFLLTSRHKISLNIRITGEKARNLCICQFSEMSMLS